MRMTSRVRQLNDAPIRPGKYVMYWAQMNRRVESNHALAFAAELADRHDLPLLFYEGLTCSYPFANDRFHAFLLEGVEETARRCATLGIGYHFELRRRRNDPNDAVYRFAKDAAALVSDDYPTFLAPVHNASVPKKIGIPYYAVDSSCIVPMAHFTKQEWAAYTIRPKIRKVLAEYLRPVPPIRVKREMSREQRDRFSADRVGECEIDHSVAPSSDLRGGRKEAERRLKDFLEHNLRRYAKFKNEPSAQATSDLSPYLHFGHISSLEVALAVREYAAEHKLIAEEFLEELIVRRELAFNFARFAPKIDSLETLPDWAQATLKQHDRDQREHVYTREQFERADTSDELWNATQREMLKRGKIHGYYRMYWGKKIIEWSPSHAEALATMLYIHDKYALDGRDPNTYANVLWCFGLHDRPWFERPIFGKVRYMAFGGMQRKTDVDAYIRENS